MKTKQIRVSDALIKAIDDLAETYDVDRKSLLNASLVITQWILKNKAVTVEICDKDGNKQSMVVPIIVG